jgi:hypothetical protein
MPIQATTTGQLTKAMKTVIGNLRHTAEHNAPAMALTDRMDLADGSSTVTILKDSQMTVADLVDGVDMVDTEDLGWSGFDITSSEVGAKVIVTDKLIRQSTPGVLRNAGRQLGAAMARKKDTDTHAVYSNLNGGTTFGAATKSMTLANLAGAITKAKGNKMDDGTLYVLQHPYAVYNLISTGTALGTATNNFPDSFSASLLKRFWSGLKPLNGVSVFEDGNLSIDSADDAIGVIAAKSAIVTLESRGTHFRRQRDESLRGWEVIILADYSVNEQDDSLGAALTYDATAPSDSA